VIVSAGVGYEFYHSSLQKFRDQKAQEKITALRLVDAFVTTYSSVRSQLSPKAPVPATYRAHSIEKLQQASRLEQPIPAALGRSPGASNRNSPADAEMAKTIEAFAALADPKPKSVLAKIDGRLVFRTSIHRWPASQSCVNCHNQLQQGSHSGISTM